MSAGKPMDNISIKVELIDMDTNTTLYERSAHISDTPAVKRINVIIPVDDLKELPATKNARFAVTYGVDAPGSSGNIIQANCQANPALCPFTRTDYALDNFAIRPEKFYVSVADGANERVNSKTPADAIFAAGYDYNLSVKATKYIPNYPSFIPADGYNSTISRNLIFTSPGTCNDTSDNNKSIGFSDGHYVDINFSNKEVGEYALTLEEDSTWTSVDQNGRDCDSNKSYTSLDTNSISGCNISEVDNIVVIYHPDHFNIDLTLKNLPNSGHTDFIYMSELNSTYNEVAVQFEGTIIAQNEDNQTVKNFSSGCVAKNVLLDLNATTISVDGIDQDIKTIAGNIINFSRHINYNSNSSTPTSDTNRTLNNIAGQLTLKADKFLDENNGTLTLDIRYNLNKHLTEPINPVQVIFNSMEVNSTAASSEAHNILTHTPKGTSTFPNNIKNFYFARVVSDLDNYPRVNFNISPLVRTPLNVDIYCKTNIINYCEERNVTVNSRVTGTTREADGWYLSINHNGELDGNVTNLTASPAIVTISPDSSPDININTIMLNNGANGLVTETFIDCSSPSSTITIFTSPVLAFEPSQYVVNCTDVNASQWTGIGQTGNVLRVTPKVDRAGKMDW